MIASIRRRMCDRGFSEFQTPILTASSPEGARDYLVPSVCIRASSTPCRRRPQQFKQLIMVAGFDKYFQIAPCFRDEDPRADRSPGEFYQLDLRWPSSPGGCVRRHRAGDRGCSRSSRQATVDQTPFPRIPMRADAEVRHRQAGPAQPDHDADVTSVSQVSASRSSPGCVEKGGTSPRHSRTGRRASRELLRQAE